ncbi:MAG: hypothetical protein LC772_06635 [Chloroflexi bacterium]|nr:hypothetical protein [Chloroflexota bacterium]
MARHVFGVMKRAQFLEELRKGTRRGAAAESIGISRETIRIAYNTEPEFAAAVEQAEMDANELVENALFVAAKTGNVQACQTWLYNRMPERWKDKRSVSLSHQFEKMSNAELLQFIAGDGGDLAEGEALSPGGSGEAPAG